MNSTNPRGTHHATIHVEHHTLPLLRPPASAKARAGLLFEAVPRGRPTRGAIRPAIGSPQGSGMSRRKPKRRASRLGDSLIVVNIAPTVGIVERLQLATAEVRELAQAKRTVERALRAAGMPRRLAERTIAAMLPAAILAEAGRLATANA